MNLALEGILEVFSGFDKARERRDHAAREAAIVGEQHAIIVVANESDHGGVGAGEGIMAVIA